VCVASLHFFNFRLCRRAPIIVWRFYFFPFTLAIQHCIIFYYLLYFFSTFLFDIYYYIYLHTCPGFNFCLFSKFILVGCFILGIPPYSRIPKHAACTTPPACADVSYCNAYPLHGLPPAMSCIWPVDMPGRVLVPRVSVIHTLEVFIDTHTLDPPSLA